MRVLVVTDAWHPQTNGVVRCLDNVGQQLRQMGLGVDYLTPQRFWTLPMPTYPEIRLSLAPIGAVSEAIAALAPDHIHIATEGPLGLQARMHCVLNGLDFTTSYHTRFPEYVAARVPVPAEMSYAYLRWFHAPAAATLVPTASITAELRSWGFEHLVTWTRGVDHDVFSPGPRQAFERLRGPHLVYVGRVSVEKNVAAFLDLTIKGTKVVVGHGPQYDELRRDYPEAIFLGAKRGAALVDCYRSADVLVFPSRTDTFGNVMLEALACGTPVAAYPVPGPIDVLTDARAGAMHTDLEAAIETALGLERADALAHARRFTWRACAEQFLAALVPVRGTRRRAA